MVFQLEIFNHSEFRIHKAYIFSKATFFNTVILFFTFLLPFLLISASRDFWITETNKFQTPNVTYINQVILQVIFENGFGAWSTVASYKSKYINDGNFINCKISYEKIQSFKNDLVLGEIVDEGLNINIGVPTNNRKVLGFQAVVVVDYSLQGAYTFKTQGLANFQKMFAAGGSSLIAYSKLKLFQKLPLPYASHYTDSTNVIQTNTALDTYLVVKNYIRRNYTVLVDDDSKMFSLTPVVGANPSNFDLFLRLRYTPQYIRYSSTFWYSLKFAWLQYLSIMFISYLFFNRARFYLFSRRFLSTTVIHPTPIKTVNDAIQ